MQQMAVQGFDQRQFRRRWGRGAGDAAGGRGCIGTITVPATTGDIRAMAAAWTGRVSMTGPAAAETMATMDVLQPYS
jgi:hypothetical protein